MEEANSAQNPVTWIQKTERTTQTCEEAAELLKKQRKMLQEEIIQLQEKLQELSIRLEQIELELQQLSRQSSDSEESMEQLQQMRARALQLQNEKMELKQEYQINQQMLQAKQQEQSKNQKNIQRVVGLCEDLMGKLEQHIADMQTMIERLKKTSGIANDIFATRFGSSAGRLGSDATARVQRYNGLIQKCISLKYRLNQVIVGLQEGSQPEKVLTR